MMSVLDGIGKIGFILESSGSKRSKKGKITHHFDDDLVSYSAKWALRVLDYCCRCVASLPSWGLYV